MDFFLLFAALFFGLGVPILGYLSDKREWNNGRCKCGGRWIQFDMDSQGGLGHKCNRCNATTWLSWIRQRQTEIKAKNGLAIWNKQEV